MINEHDELQIQKCVDGELDVAAQQELLAMLDEMADGWKVLALAYVEEQAWCGSFDETNHEVTMLEHAAFEPIPQATGMEQFELREVQCFMPPQSESGEPRQSATRSALVTQLTCLAIALVGGVLIGDAWRARGGGNVGSNNIAKGDHNTDNNRSNRLEPKDLVSAPHQPAALTSNPAAGFANSTTRLPSGFGLKLREHGYDIIDEPRWLKIQLDDGNYAIVPLERQKIVPVGQ